MKDHAAYTGTAGLLILLLLMTGAVSVTARNPHRYRDLPELVVETRKHNVLHLLAYVREYSTLTTYSDTIFMFREKLADFMLPQDRKSKFRGWNTPRMLKCESYYRFTDRQGLDSVSDVCDHHFSWSDWIGIPPPSLIPQILMDKSSDTDTIHGKYSPVEIWTKRDDHVSVTINALADSTGRRWVPDMESFFRQKEVDFSRFKAKFDYDNVLGYRIFPTDLSSYSYEIDSYGRGRVMFRFNKPGEQYYVNTRAEVYVLDREYITTREARKWEDHNFDKDGIEIYRPPEAAAISPDIEELMARVDNIDRQSIRLMQNPDMKLGCGKTRTELRKNFQLGNRLLLMLKRLTGISLIKSKKKQKENWERFRNNDKNEEEK